MNHTPNKKFTIKPTQEIALETLYGSNGVQGVIPRITRLTFDEDVTTAELEEALRLIPALRSAIGAWVSSRHLIESTNHRVSEARLKVETNTPEMDAAMDHVPTIPATNRRSA